MRPPAGRGAPRAGERGLTLIEVMVTMLILAAAGSLVYGAFAAALDSWRRGMAMGREELVVRVVMERMGRQLRSAVRAPAKRDGKEAVAFAVGEDHVRFVTLQASRGVAPAQVSYSVEEEGGKPALVYREYPWPDKEFFKEPKPVREERLPEVAGLKVKVTRRRVGEEDLSESELANWKATDGSGLPATVELKVVPASAAGGQGAGELTLVVRLPAEGVQ